MSRRTTSRFVISSFPQPPQLDPHFASETWATLSDAIREINSRNTSNLSFEQLYRFSYNMVLHKHGDFLYDNLTQLLTEHLRTVAEVICAAPPPSFLHELKRQWGWFSLSLAHVRDILMYMDRHFVKSKQKKTVHELGLSLFRDVVVRHEHILPRLSETLLEHIDRERNGEQVDVHLIRAITRMLAELGNDLNSKPVYVNVFEDGFLERTRQFYAREARLYLSETTCSDYLRKASRRINEERMRVESYLEKRTEAKVRQVTEVELISRYMDTLVDMGNSGLIWMLRNDKIPDLKLMYSLFADIERGEELMRTKLKNEVLERGTDVVQDVENVRDPVTLINAILSLKQKYDNILNRAFILPKANKGNGSLDLVGSLLGSAANAASSAAGFRPVSLFTFGSSSNEGLAPSLSPPPNVPAVVPEHVSLLRKAVGLGASTSASASGSADTAESQPDKRFVSAVNEAFERFLNSFSRAPEYISLYVDKLLRKDFKSGNDDDIESKLDAVMTLFRFLSEKDVFERYYKLHLTKRLLHSRTASSDSERSMISKLKTECGYLYTSKMEIMFNDMKTSEDTTSAFKEKVAREAADMRGIDLSVSVLTTMSWPISSADKVSLPLDVRHCMQKFEEYYYVKHDGRRLTWQASLGTAEIVGRFGGGSRVVDLYSVSAYSMCILMLFNEKDCLSYREIEQATHIPEKELIRHLQSLSLGKHRVLRKEPREKEVKPDDKFHFNNDFTSRNRRIKMQVISAQKETEGERNQTKCRVDDDRRPVIDTVIVRIMKHRKRLEHNLLMSEVTMQLASRFEPNPQDIKKRIESLVEREYLERQKDNHTIYRYLA